MPSFSEKRSSYRLSADEVVAMSGLSVELAGLVQEGLRAAVGRGDVPVGVDPFGAFWSELAERRHRDVDTKYLLGFGAARPLLPADRVLLGRRLKVKPDELGCLADPVSLYELGRLIDDRRDRAGVFRRALADGCEDETRVLNVVGMPMVQRKRQVTLVQILHAAWRSDSREQAGLLASRWPLAVTRRTL